MKTDNNRDADLLTLTTKLFPGLFILPSHSCKHAGAADQGTSWRMQVVFECLSTWSTLSTTNCFMVAGLLKLAFISSSCTCVDHCNLR